MNATVTERVTLPAGTKMKWITDPPRPLEEAWDTSVPPVLVRDDGSTIPYLCEVTSQSGVVRRVWLYADQVEENLDEFPEPPESLTRSPGEHGWEEALANTRWWCEESALPVLDSVDEQANWLLNDYHTAGDVVLGRPEPIFILFPYGWASTGEGKDYLGRVMRRARKVRAARSAEAPVETPAETPVEETVEARPVDQEIAMLTETISNLRQSLARAQQWHTQDIDTIGAALMEEAESRSWCDEYDAVVERLNRSLHFELPVRETEVEGTFDVSLTVNVRWSNTVTVPGGSTYSDVASEDVDEDTIAYEVQRALERQGINVDNVEVDSCDNFEED